MLSRWVISLLFAAMCCSASCRAAVAMSKPDGDQLNGTQASKVVFDLFSAMVNVNMTRMADLLLDDMQFIVLGQPSHCSCIWNGKTAFVDHISGVLALFNLTVSWVNQAIASYDRVIIDIGFSFISVPRKQLAVMPQTMIMITIGQDAKGIWKVKTWLEMGMTSNNSEPNAQWMDKAFQQLNTGFSTKNLGMIVPLLADNFTFSNYDAGQTSLPQSFNKTVFLDSVAKFFPTLDAKSFYVRQLYASCRFAFYMTVEPTIINRVPRVIQSMGVFGFNWGDLNGGKARINMWYRFESIMPGNPYTIPAKIPDPVNN